MSLKSLAYFTIICIIVSLLIIVLSFADEPFQPVMPTTQFTVHPSGTTTGSSPEIKTALIQHNLYLIDRTMDQIQIVVSSSTTTYHDGWYKAVRGQYPIVLNLPVGTEYVVSMRGWNNNGFGPWVISELNTVVAKGTDCYTNFTTYTYPPQTNPACN